MTKNRKQIIIFGAILSGIFLILMIFFIALFPWLAIRIGTQFTPDPSKPVVEYGEFPFKAVYEVDGNTFTINDTYICEYVGVGMNEGTGKYRSWKGYIKSTGKEKIFLKKEGNIEFYLNVGSPEYYMNDNDGKSTDFEPYIATITKVDNVYSHGTIPFDLAAHQYNINIVNVEISKPSGDKAVG